MIWSMSEGSIRIWLRCVYVPVWKGNCRRSFELHGLPYYHDISCRSTHHEAYQPPSGLCAFPFLDAGFSRSGVRGLAYLGFFSSPTARIINHTVRHSNPTLYNNIFGLTLIMWATSEVLSRTPTDSAHIWKLCSFVSPIFKMDKRELRLWMVIQE